MYLDKYYTILVQERQISYINRLQFYLDYLYKGIEFEGKKVLDIGGGSGLLTSFYAASMGASYVYCLEPEIEGTQTEAEAINKFKEVRQKMGLTDRVKLGTFTIQDYDAGHEKFDVIISHDSVNHFDENACINLKHDKHAKEKYDAIFRKLYELANDGASLVIADCSRFNFFALCRIKNPLAPYIEWQKHQSPFYWASALTDVGFTTPRIRWRSFNSLGSFGKIAFGNVLASFFYNSHFCLTMKKSNALTDCGYKESYSGRNE